MRKEQNITLHRILLLEKLLYETTDENHPITTMEIIEYMKSHGIDTNRKTITNDIKIMVQHNFDIITIHSKPNKYFWGSRSFEQAELKLLIDAVSSSRFITQKKSQVLSNKLISLSSKDGQAELTRHIYATNRVKSNNEDFLYTIDTVNSAITQNKKISFQYFEYSSTKEKVLRNNGEIYTLSPYALFWNEDYYYVVGFSDKHMNISVFRADRMHGVDILNIDAEPKPSNFSIDKYSCQIFKMYNGDLVNVRLECQNYLMKYVIDRFGEDVDTSIASENTFYVNAEVALSPNFYSWLFQFAGSIRILAPSNAIVEMKNMAKAFCK